MHASRPNVGSDASGIREIHVKTWEEFEDQLREMRKCPTGWAESPLLYRGQIDSDWELETTLERNERPQMLLHEYYRLILNVRPQIEAFTGKRWVIPTYLTVKEWTNEYYKFSLRLTRGALPGYDYMAYLRHHGFPSPLLDWSRSLHVAAFFAFRRAAHNKPNKQVSIYVFAEPRFTSGSNSSPSIIRLGPYVRTHQRHFLQQSEYTLCVQFDDEWHFESYKNAFEHRGRGYCWKFNIPATERLKVLKVLDEYNLNAFSLLNSEESLSETMALREFHFNGKG
jgi:FRG domain